MPASTAISASLPRRYPAVAPGALNRACVPPPLLLPVPIRA